MKDAHSAGSGKSVLFVRVLLLVALLLGFLASVELMSKAIKGLSSGALGEEESLFALAKNPFAALSLGALFTVLVQSSSTTTSTIVAMVGSGVLGVGAAVPMVMGANIGTTITNTLVAIGHVRRSAEFKRAFAAATVHDFFNLICVLVMFPLELSTGFLSRGAEALTGMLSSGGASGGSFKSPIKGAIKAVAGVVKDGLAGIGLEGSTLYGCQLAVGILLTLICLAFITRTMRLVMAGRFQEMLNNSLGGNPMVGMGAGAVITVSVQSSSVTTSLLVPMCAAGVMTLETAFPVMLGANVGTTVTGVLASLAQEAPAALTIALVHVMFNVLGIAMIYPIAAIRRIPMRMADGLAGAAVQNRMWISVYVFGTFVLLPLCGWLIWRDSA